MGFNIDLHSGGLNCRYFLSVQPYSLYWVVPATLDAGERSFPEKRERKEEKRQK